jgi:hypothetical protein
VAKRLSLSAPSRHLLPVVSLITLVSLSVSQSAKVRKINLSMCLTN